MRKRSTDCRADEWLVWDRTEPCPYLPQQTARMPLRLPQQHLADQQVDAALEAGDRRCGRLLYRPQCPVCRACQAIRLPVAEFRSTAGQRRAWRRGEQQLTCHVGEPAVDARRVRLFNRHRLERGLATQSISADEYAGFLVASCCPMIEFDFFHGAQLAAVAIADRGQTSLSAVYCYYDPRLSGHSLGTYAILKQVDFCRQQRLRFLYLGLFVAANPHMSYKDRFRPNERLVDGKWRRIED